MSLGAVVCGGWLAACATLGTEGAASDTPSAQVGPFRPLLAVEVAGEPPLVLARKQARYADPAAWAAPDGVWLFVAADDAAGVTRIVATPSRDGRGFVGSASAALPLEILAPGPAAGEAFSNPELVLGPSGELRMYYAIKKLDRTVTLGLATGSASVLGVFERAAAAPRFDWPADALGFGIARDALGGYHLFAARGASLWEWQSADGIDFSRPPSEVLRSETVPAETALAEPTATYDAVFGRSLLRVWFTEYVAGVPRIRFAGREGDSGGLTLSPAISYSVGRGEHAPAVVRVGGLALLYVQQNSRADYPAIGAGVAPSRSALGPSAEEPAP